MSERTTKSVSFNLVDEFDMKLLGHAEKLNSYGKKRNFSKYVKRLIEKDMLKESNGPVEDKISEPIQEYQDEDSKNAMNSFL
ncbi:hypothetical protein [Psychrobacillus sp. FSL K6-1267]|uniref:hypothetical protein n=1 Tax=Psychrobacillus sp. FSL K6-1267 TaxID=2921543 RepID=UPI0030FADBBD